MNKEKLRIVSGIQPTGKLHIGNYLGMLKQSIALQETHDCFFFIVDLHSLTQAFNPTDKRAQIFETMVDMLALGFNPKNCTLFVQSHISAHTDLTWILNCLTPFAELKRMTQFKDKSLNDPKNINAGLFDYPVLQTADILLYKPVAVPVGKDQAQHLELSRQLARTFNKKFGKLFFEPKPLFTETPVIMSLADPTKKMSKSHGEDKVISIDDEPDTIAKKIAKAVTDTKGAENLLTLLKAFVEKEIYEVFERKNRAGNIRYKDLKDTLAKAIGDHFAKYREHKKKLMKDKMAVITTFAQGAKKARKIADATMHEVREHIGLV